VFQYKTIESQSVVDLLPSGFGGRPLIYLPMIRLRLYLPHDNTDCGNDINSSMIPMQDVPVIDLLFINFTQKFCGLSQHSYVFMLVTCLSGLCYLLCLPCIPSSSRYIYWRATYFNLFILIKTVGDLRTHYLISECSIRVFEYFRSNCLSY